MSEGSPATLSRVNSNAARWLAPAAAVAALATLFFFDPVQSSFYPVCWFHKLTGLECPGCGATRAAFALVHGQFLIAIHDNALFVASLPLVAVYFVRKYRARNQTPKVRLPGHPRVWPWIALGVLILFGILRNLPYPAFQWMSP